MIRTLIPSRGHVLVQQDAKQSQTKSGLHLPQGNETWPPVGTVVRLGLPERDSRGVEIEFDFSVGARVMFTRRPASALDPDSREGESEFKDLLVLKSSDIVGVITEE
jgi:co-chaperonin GroES (HSP10)